MAVMWDKYVTSSRDYMIWCAVIALERHSSEEIWGKIEWVDAVLSTVVLSYKFVCALTATI
ncbi:hypothetical protein ARALYDRAFT_899655 [Arabidopsis lyrata subsp. lyrata]|uniref:Uncharacterized protein n=1 Tax=Arabidopsis lyrata subsp. lyrata TaxID=81972 RepID=D7L1T5_ARALL|nr:hypothetical protein ARALYDRAFT_899655 [Arabidopsis lyrata subsp. lyrata]